MKENKRRKSECHDGLIGGKKESKISFLFLFFFVENLSGFFIYSFFFFLLKIYQVSSSILFSFFLPVMEIYIRKKT